MGLYKFNFFINNLYMDQQHLFEPIPCDKYDLLSKEEVIDLHKDSQDLIRQMQSYVKELHAKYLASEQKSFLLGEQTINIKNRLFGKSSEKSANKNISTKIKKQSRKRVLLPSERYPNLDIIEKRVELDKVPTCPCCNEQMKDSGLTEDSEYLTTQPKRYYIIKQQRVKYNCGSCYGALVTAPAIPRIKPGSSYSDEMVVDVALSKYCDLIPVERYTQMAARDGVKGLPANTLIQSTHNLADFLTPIYEKIKSEVLNSKVIHADETPHRMLGGDKKSNWYLWGFSTNNASYFEAHDTRSGDVASSFINKSNCEYLISDVFSGYKKAVRESNVYRKEKKLKLIKNVYCNAHARRKFKESEQNFIEEANFFLWCYRKIYRLEKLQDFAKRRKWQRLYFKAMELVALKIKNNYSSKSSIVKAINYFINNYNELTIFLKYDDIPIDNNSQERLMRSPVIGRKTWYGTHSKRGALTNAMLFSLVESCKINKVNPREYFKEIVLAIHQNQTIFTPAEYLATESENIA